MQAGGSGALSGGSEGGRPGPNCATFHPLPLGEQTPSTRAHSAIRVRTSMESSSLPKKSKVALGLRAGRAASSRLSTHHRGLGSLGQRWGTPAPLEEGRLRWGGVQGLIRGHGGLCNLDPALGSTSTCSFPQVVVTTRGGARRAGCHGRGGEVGSHCGGPSFVLCEKHREGWAGVNPLATSVCTALARASQPLHPKHPWGSWQRPGTAWEINWCF
ncbi:hypothetical protein H8959_010084 [Pygathrix nigripes]